MKNTQRFIVTRTSIYGNKRPCKEAKRAPYTRIDERTFNDPAKIDWVGGLEEWYGNGTNHRVTNGHIQRDFEDSAWFVEFESLDDLMAFVNRYGAVVIGEWYSNHDIRYIEIYDGYRE